MVETRVIRIPNTLHPLLKELGSLAQKIGLSAYTVGGCVRDWLLGLEGAVDIDVMVEGDGIAFARQASETLGGRLQVYLPFGTATLELPIEKRAGKPKFVDIASCRREFYKHPGDYPQVTPGTLKEDLFRRDFTINAMAMMINAGSFGKLVDPFNGCGDLKEKKLRVLHRESFIDDSSRILRGIRFAQRFKLNWDLETVRLRREAIEAGALGWLNAGRLGKELERMGDEPNPKACFLELAAFLLEAQHASDAR